MTQQELAEKTGYLQSTISLWMSDGRRDPKDWSRRMGGRPSLKAAKRLAEATGIPAEVWRCGFLTPDMCAAGIVDLEETTLRPPETAVTVKELLKNAPY